MTSLPECSIVNDLSFLFKIVNSQISSSQLLQPIYLYACSKTSTIESHISLRYREI